MQQELLGLVRVFPLWLSYGVMAVAIPFYVLADGRARRASYRFYRLRMGYGCLKSAAAVFRNMYNMGKVVIDRFCAYAGKKYRIESTDLAVYERMASAQGGLVVLSSHVGNYEMVGYMLPSPKPRKVLVYGGETATVMKNRDKLFSSTNVSMVPVKEDLSHIFALNNALADGEIVSVPADRTFGSRKTLRIPFLGADAAFPAGPFTLAVQREVPVVAMFVMKESRKLYRARVQQLPVPQEGTRAQKVQALAAAYVKVLEEVVRQWPEQWYNFYDFWADETL